MFIEQSGIDSKAVRPVNTGCHGLKITKLYLEYLFEDIQQKLCAGL